MAEEFVSHLRWLFISSFIPFYTSFVVCDIFDDGNLLQGCFTLANNYLKWKEHRELLFNTVPVLPKPVGAAHRPLPHSLNASLSFQFSCIIPSTLRVLMFVQHTYT